MGPKADTIVTTSAEPGTDGIPLERRLEMYRLQFLVRQSEQRAYELFLQNLIKGTSHLSLDQKAIAAAAVAAMQPGDLSFCTYRRHACSRIRRASITDIPS